MTNVRNSFYFVCNLLAGIQSIETAMMTRMAVIQNIFTAYLLMYWFPCISIIIQPQDTDPCNHIGIGIHGSFMLSKAVIIILITISF